MNLTLVIYFQIYYLPFMILCLQVQKRASSGGGLGFHGLVEAEEATVSMEIPLLSNHQHSGGESVQLDRLPSQQKEAQLVWREFVHAAFPQGQHRALIL